MIALVLAIVLAAALAWRVAWRTYVERSVRARLPVGPDGIVPGAAPIELRAPASGGAVLLLHGFGDTPQSLAELAHGLHDRGFNVSAPLLPGHGRALRDFRASNGSQWVAEARRALEELRAHHESVGIVGLSMGGALAVLLATDSGELPALVLLSPYLEPPFSVRLLAKIAYVAGAILPYLYGRNPRSIHYPVARAATLVYGAATPRSVAELVRLADRARARLPRVQAPTLYMQSREDYRVPVGAAERAFAALGASRKKLQWLTGCGHVITVDYGREKVAEMVASWMEEYVDRNRAAGARSQGESGVA